MIKTLLLFSVVIFAIGGICDFIYVIRLLLFTPGRRFGSYILVVLNKEFAMKQLAFLWQKIVWHGETFASGIIAVTDNLDTKEIIRCNDFITDKKIYLCTLNDLSKINLKEFS